MAEGTVQRDGRKDGRTELNRIKVRYPGYMQLLGGVDGEGKQRREVEEREGSTLCVPARHQRGSGKVIPVGVSGINRQHTGAAEETTY